jgi:signal transduction histidine kinase
MAGATTSMVVIAFVIPLGLAVQTIAANEALNDAEVEARSLAPAIATVRDPQTLADLVQSASATSSGRLSVFLPDGQVLGATASADANVTLGRAGRAFTTFTPDGAEVFIPVVISGSGTAVVEVVVPESRLHRGVSTAWAILAATGLGLILLAVFVADRIARGVVVPTSALADAAQRVAQGELQTRVVPDGPPEVVEVGRAFNLLVGRIGELLTSEREAAADLSHRLRTPLTALRLNVDRMPADSTTERLAAEVNAVENAVSDVIHQLRRHSREGIRSTTDLVAVARERLAFWAALAGQQGRPCTIEVGPGTEMVALARDDAATLVDVLLNNVFAHTPDRTPFKVAIDHVAEDQVRLVVEDQGPGFPAAMTARGASGTGSTGLGLDIARRVADAVGGSLTTSTSPEGGARVEVVMKTV